MTLEKIVQRVSKDAAYRYLRIWLTSEPFFFRNAPPSPNHGKIPGNVFRLHEQAFSSEGRSCADLLLATIDGWMIAKDHKMSTSIVFIDLSKAFDNVRHDKPINQTSKTSGWAALC